MAKYLRVAVWKQDGTMIPPEEPVFVLRAQDMLAPIAVRFYADLIQGATGDFRVAEQIRDFAILMSHWPTRKLPD